MCIRDSVEVRRYRYLDSNTKTTLDYEGMKEDLMNAEAGSTILLHACAHNPTGVDPTPEQWRVAVWNSCCGPNSLVDFHAGARSHRRFWRRATTC